MCVEIMWAEQKRNCMQTNYGLLQFFEWIVFVCDIVVVSLQLRVASAWVEIFLFYFFLLLHFSVNPPLWCSYDIQYGYIQCIHWYEDEKKLWTIGLFDKKSIICFYEPFVYVYIYSFFFLPFYFKLPSCWKFSPKILAMNN